MNDNILRAIESLCDDIATNTNAEDNQKRANAILALAFGGIFTPEEIDEDYTEDTLPGKVVSKKDNQLMLTTIPYDAGWIVTVDGERVETEEMIDSLLAFHVDAGEHEVVLKYRPKTFTLGLTASLFFLAIFVLLLVFVPKMKRPCFLLTGVPTEKEDESDTAPKKRTKDKETGENTKKNAKNSPKK